MSIDSEEKEVSSTAMSTKFKLGSVEVEKTNGGYWLQVRHGRSRFIPKDSDTARKIEAGYNFTKLDAAQRTMAAGTHESVTYFRNSEGNIEIPPDPSFPTPANCERFTANNLRELDRLSAEMDREMERKFEGEAQWADTMQDVMGNPRQALVDRLGQGGLSNLGRDIIREMISQHDKEAEYRPMNVENRFWVRNMDGRG